MPASGVTSRLKHETGDAQESLRRCVSGKHTGTPVPKDNEYAGASLPMVRDCPRPAGGKGEKCNNWETGMNKKRQRRMWKRHVRKQPRSFCVVYGLCGPDGRVRYIGQTRQRLEDRLQYFYKQIANKRIAKERLTPVEKWVDSLSFHGIDAQIMPIDTNATWDVSEIIYIERYRAAGFDLLNVTRGGADGPGNLRREASRPKEAMPC